MGLFNGHTFIFAMTPFVGEIRFSTKCLCTSWPTLEVGETRRHLLFLIDEGHRPTHMPSIQCGIKHTTTYVHLVHKDDCRYRITTPAIVYAYHVPFTLAMSYERNVQVSDKWKAIVMEHKISQFSWGLHKRFGVNEVSY